jgi:hypothetical protein
MSAKAPRGLTVFLTVASIECGRKGSAIVKLAIFNIGKILSGDIASPVAAGDTIIVDGDKIGAVGTGGNVADFDVAIDAGHAGACRFGHSRAGA